MLSLVVACTAVTALAGSSRDVAAPAALTVGQGSCGLLLLLAARDGRAGMARVWRLCGASALSSSLLFVVWTYYAVRYGALPPVPSLADLFYVTSVLLLIAAALCWPVADRRPQERLRYVLDAAVVTSALVLIAWEVLISPGLSGVEERSWQTLLPLTYPVLDMLGVGAALYAVSAARPATRPAAALLLLGTALVSAGDALYAVLLAAGSWDHDPATVGLWVAAFAALVVARVAPAGRTGAGRGATGASDGSGRSALTRAAVLLPVVPVAAAVAVSSAREVTGASLVIGAAMVALLMLRYSLLGLADRSVLRALEQDASTDAAFLDAALQHLDQPVLACDADGTVRFFNRAFATLRPQVTVGMDTTAPGAASGLFREDGVTPVPDEELPIVRALRTGAVPAHVLVTTPDTGRERYLSWQGRRIVGRQGELLGAVTVGRDVTEERQARAQLLRRALTDELTGLPNRAGFSADLAECERECPTYAVMLLDLDDFKNVNDSLGHHVGDVLLSEVAARVRAVLRPGDRAARLGGDEFVLLARGADAPLAEALANRLLTSLDEPVGANGHELTVSASIGIALRDPEVDRNLLAAADLAMYLAKQRGKGGIAVFEPHMQEAAQNRLALENDLRRAIRNEQLHVVYQPIVDLESGAMAGVEALVRWDDPARGPVSPADFVPVAEESGLIFSLGEWVLREAAAQVRRWNEEFGVRSPAVSVNVSSRQLERHGLLTTVDALLHEGLDPAQLVMEITETALTLDDSAAAETLHQLRDRGIHLAVDDFGTGYSSLGRLRAAPVNRLKVDRSFVSEIRHDGSNVPIIDATMAMSHGLGLGVVAEGVETTAQLHYLRRLGCAQAQGYLLSRPVPASGIADILRGDAPWSDVLSSTGESWDGREHELTHLYDLAVSGDGDLELLVRPLLDDLQRLTGLSSTYLMRMSPDGAHQTIAFANTTSPPPLVEGATVTWEESLCRRSMERGIGRTSDATRDFPDTDIAARLGITSYIGAPVYDADNHLYGTLCAASTEPVALTEANEATVRLFARLVAERLRVGGVVQRPAAGRPAASHDPQAGEQRQQALEHRRAVAQARWTSAHALLSDEATHAARAALVESGSDTPTALRSRTLRREAHDAMRQHARQVLSSLSDTRDDGALRVMVADDDAVMRQVVTHLVDVEPGLQVVAEAVSGAAAIGVTVAEQPDLLILDYDLGDAHADDLVPALRQFAPATRILLYSSRAEVHHIGQRLGVDRSVHKLEGPQRLVEAVHAFAS